MIAQSKPRQGESYGEWENRVYEECRIAERQEYELRNAVALIFHPTRDQFDMWDAMLRLCAFMRD